MTEFPLSPIGEVATVRSGYAFKSSDWKDFGTPVVKIANVKSGRLSMDGCSFVDDAVARDAHEFRLAQGDILIAMTGYIGEVAVVRESDLPALLNQRVGRFSIRDARRLDRRFLYYAITSPNIRQEIEGLGYGSAQPNVSPSLIQSVKIPIPSIQSQQATASVLGALDDKIELNRRMNETLEAMARAIFKDWFVDFGPTRAKMEGRAPYLAPDVWSLFPDRLDDEGKPEGWGLRPVGDFAELRGGKQLEKERITSSGTIPVFGGAGVMGFTDEHNADGFVISVGRVGAYCGQFFSHRGKAWINNNASLIRQFEGVSGEWLFQSLRHADIEVIKKGAAQPFVSNTDVGNMPIIWPGERVVSRFADVAVPLMLRMEHNDAEASTLATTRDFLLPKLMSGEVRVKNAEKLVGEVT